MLIYIYIIFEGLVDGQRLRKEQYLAIQDRDTAHRLYITGRQKFRRTNKIAANDGDASVALPPVEVTRITDEIFSTWVEEVHQQEMQVGICVLNRRFFESRNMQ